MDRAALTAAVKQEAGRLGFSLVGVTTPDPPPHLAAFAAWLDQGRHGGMAYLATERARARRSDPRAVLPGCRSILVAGMRHAAPAESPGPHLAAYAAGRDYHDVLVPRLEALMSFLRPLAGPSFAYRLYSDTGPVLERDLAQRAGLGWIGKNTCLIHPRHGSYFLLAEAFLSVDLEPDVPVTVDHCGSCTRCLEACPTACILPDRTLDARRCLSYLTIENRGSIPVELRPAVGDWLFGCDICQQVCPWNRRFARPDGEPALTADPPTETDASAYLEGQADLKGRATSRAGRARMARNAAVVLGNLRKPEALPALDRVLRTHSDPIVRAHAAWGMGQVGGHEAASCLRRAAASERDPMVLEEVAGALARLAASSPVV